MVSRAKVLFDIDVILDVLQAREPFFDMSARVLAGAERGQWDGWVAAHSLTTLFYLLARHGSAERARLAVAELIGFLEVAAVDRSVIELALRLPVTDFEDAVQMACGARIGADYVVTRNVRHYRSGPLPALSPAELAALG